MRIVIVVHQKRSNDLAAMIYTIQKQRSVTAALVIANDGTRVESVHTATVPTNRIPTIPSLLTPSTTSSSTAVAEAAISSMIYKRRRRRRRCIDDQIHFTAYYWILLLLTVTCNYYSYDPKNHHHSSCQLVMVVTPWTQPFVFHHNHRHHLRPQQQQQQRIVIFSFHNSYPTRQNFLELKEQTRGNDDNDSINEDDRKNNEQRIQQIPTNDDTKRIENIVDRVLQQTDTKLYSNTNTPKPSEQPSTHRSGKHKKNNNATNNKAKNYSKNNNRTRDRVPTATTLASLLPPLPIQEQLQQGFVPSKGNNKIINRKTELPHQNERRKTESSPKQRKANSSSSYIAKGKNSSSTNSKPSKVSGNGFGKVPKGVTTTTSKATAPKQNKEVNAPMIETLPDPGSAKKRKYTSLLPPYLESSDKISTSSTLDDRESTNQNRNDNTDDNDDDFVTNGLSSWEQFLGRGNRAASLINPSSENIDNLNQTRSNDPDQIILESALNQFPSGQQQLPSIQDLFPPDLTTLSDAKVQGSVDVAARTSVPSFTDQSELVPPTGSFLDGVLPVSDLFYRSSQQQFGSGDEEHDDEELPFSAEQSDAITSDENKVRVRQNMVQQTLPIQQGDMDAQRSVTPLSEEKFDVNSSSSEGSIGSKDKSRRMIRRGMEMLVGGIPIFADPPQRSVQITYNQPPKNGGYDWASTISLNTREFGPLLHTESIAKVPDFERGLFCEYFCHSAIKWDVCPKDLRQIVSTHRAATVKLTKEPDPLIDIGDAYNNDSESVEKSEFVASSTNDNSGDDEYVGTCGEIRFEIGVTREELETGSDGADGSDIFQSVFVKAFHSILERAINASTTKKLWDDVIVHVSTLTLEETDDGYTSGCAEFHIEANDTTTDTERELRLSKIGSAFSRSMEDGGFALAIAAAAKEEMRWPKAVRNRVVEECLFQDDDGDESIERIHWTRTESPVMYDREVGLVLPARIGDGRSSLFKGGGTDGVFHDFSAMNALNAPYSGEIGLRLVDAVTERAKQRQPKVIAIGDVHGCIDELQDLLRQCDFRPGDLVVFLGDLVCKGPDSIAVVQMAREIGAIGVRGNHDFEVVRWHQAIKSGVDPPVFGSEHYHIAACLSNADMSWMHSLPWYISSKDLSALFVHAGFVSGIRLAKQNPRLMMNMRSILPDGTVTSKFFNNWPWARLWDGPQTVLFGHDADRGLQQYEHAIGLDTGCVYGGRLTACILPEKKLVSVSAKRKYFKYRRKHYD